MIVHKIIETAEAAVYLPFAQSKLRWLARNATYAVVQNYVVDDITIRIEHNPSIGQQSLRLSGGAGVKYEFFTSDARPYPFEAPVYYGHTTNVTIGKTFVRSKMAASYNKLNDAPLCNPPATSGAALANWVGIDAYNKQKVSFVQNYTTTISDTGKTTLHYTTVPVTAIPLLANRPVNAGSSFEEVVGHAFPSSYNVDIGWDVGNPVYKDGGRIALLQPLLPPPYWWRRGTVILAKDALGGLHPITVVTDNMSNFHFFRTTLSSAHTLGMDGSDVRFVPESSRVTVQASTFLPGWVEQPTANTMKPPGSVMAPQWLQNWGFPTSAQYAYTSDPAIPGGDGWAGSANRDDTVQECHYLWVFNSDGSAASAQVRENKGDIKYHGYTHEFVDGHYTAKVMRWGFYNVWIPPETEASDAGFFAAHGGLTTLQARVPGLLSIKIDITVTGGGPTDFTVAISPTLEVKERWYVDIAYAMNHPKLAAKGIKPDDLLTTELELYGDNQLHDTEGQFTTMVSCPTFTIRNTTSGVDSVPLVQFGGTNSLNTLSGSDYADVPRDSSMITRTIASGANLGGVNGDVYVVTVLPWFTQSGYGREILASDLKALAFVFADYSFNGGSNSIPVTSGIRLFMFGEEISSVGEPPLAEQYAPPNLSLYPTKLPIYPIGDIFVGPYSFYSLYSACAEFFCSDWVHLNILNVHPTGNYSAYATVPDNPDFGVLDIIASCTTNADGSVAYNKTTHKSMFNSAFAQTRDYSDYYSPGGYIAGVPASTTGGIYPYGGFATAGMWL